MQGSAGSAGAKPSPTASPAADTTATPAGTGAPKPAQPAAAATATPPAAGAPKPVTPAANGAATSQRGCGPAGSPCGGAPKTLPVTDNSTNPRVAGAPKPAQPSANIADASVCGTGGPGCDRSILATPVHNTTPGQPGGSGGSCGANGSSCPTPQPPAPPAPGSPVGPSNAGTGGTGGPGNAGGSGSARLNAAGSADPNATGAVAGGPKQNTLDPNQSANTARGPPADPTNPNAAPNNPGPVKPAPGSPADDGGFFGGIKRAWGSLVGNNYANEPTNGGYVPAHGNVPAQGDNTGLKSVDLVEKEADVFGYIPATAPEGRIAGGAIRGAKELSSRALYGNRTRTPEVPAPSPGTSTPRGEPSAGAGPGRNPVDTNPRAGAANPGETSPAVADPGPGRIINRPSAKPGTRSTQPGITRPGVTRPSGRPDSPAGTGPGNRPSTRSTANPSNPGEPAPVAAGGTRPPVSNSGAGRGPGDSAGEPPSGMADQRPHGPDSVSGGRGDETEPAEGLPAGGQPQAHSAPEENVAPGPSSTKPPTRDETGPSEAGPHPAQNIRESYNSEVTGLSKLETQMRAQGKDNETIARTLHQARRDLGEKYKNLTPEAERERIYARNLREYKDRLGPSIEYLRNVRGKSWEQIIESAKRTSGQDLGYKGNQ